VEAVREAAPTTLAPPRALAAPETIHVSVSGRCDQACAGCFYSARPGSAVPPHDMPFALFAKVVRQAAAMKVFQIALGGGEPTLHPQLVEMVRLARQNGIVPNLTTNGNHLTRDLAVALREAGLGQAQISLNGASEEANSATRPNFRAALAAFEACRAAGLPFGLNFLLTRSSADELEAVLVLGREKGAATVNLLRPKPPTTESDWLERESLNADEYRQVQQRLRFHPPSSPPYEGGDRGGVKPMRVTLDASLTFLLTDRSPEALYRNGVGGCSAARRFVTVTQDGDVLPCSHVRWSDVGEGDVRRAWWDSAFFARFRALEETLRGPCRACSHLPVCRGCPAVVMAFGGEFADSDPHCPRRAVLNPPADTARCSPARRCRPAR
jgi:radical SAM protein with 4Fe4S-binding SPASM domain